MTFDVSWRLFWAVPLWLFSWLMFVWLWRGMALFVGVKAVEEAMKESGKPNARSKKAVDVQPTDRKV